MARFSRYYINPVPLCLWVRVWPHLFKPRPESFSHLSQISIIWFIERFLRALRVKQDKSKTFHSSLIQSIFFVVRVSSKQSPFIFFTLGVWILLGGKSRHEESGCDSSDSLYGLEASLGLSIAIELLLHRWGLRRRMWVFYTMLTTHFQQWFAPLQGSKHRNKHLGFRVRPSKICRKLVPLPPLLYFHVLQSAHPPTDSWIHFVHKGKWWQWWIFRESKHYIAWTKLLVRRNFFYF